MTTSTKEAVAYPEDQCCATCRFYEANSAICKWLAMPDSIPYGLQIKVAHLKTDMEPTDGKNCFAWQRIKMPSTAILGA